ncbi:ABC transporter substrate-binding protein [Blastopirellula marina]|uniref:Putative iron complex transport system substrate-binding protein n=1 Tax=Blastopirellula marina DSM 3645 TaxID=314230 RepID=A3ZPB1_9BACT|nr:ABC transporter substrate-binding protein [Blastopirellula marina]EAQ81589.1 putative iron complex transport system substrate-binding protein [Blastopirellula marina DSM 3645]
MRQNLNAFFLLAIIGATILAGCSDGPRPRQTPPADDTLTVVDLAGRTLTLKRPIKRIVLMRSLCIYELATVLGDEVEEKLVGWDSSLKTGDQDAYEKFVQRYPGLKELNVLGDVLRDTVSAEAVLALNPDLVIMSTYMRDRNSKGLERLEDAGVPLLYLDFTDPFRDPQRSILLLGEVLGKQQRAEAAAAWIDRQFAEVTGRLEKIDSPAPRIYLEAGTLGASQYGNTFGSDDHGKLANWGSVMDQLRCRNVAAGSVSGMYGMGVISPELLLTEDPQVIVITGAHWTAFPDSLRLGYFADPEQTERQLSEYANRPGWSNLQAVKSGRVHAIHTRFGGHITCFAAAQQLAKWLYPNELETLDPEARLREYHERFMPIEYSGAWMTSLKDE